MRRKEKWLYLDYLDYLDEEREGLMLGAVLDLTETFALSYEQALKVLQHWHTIRANAAA